MRLAFPWMRVLGIGASFAMIGCATTILDLPLDWQMIDNPKMQRVELRYRNSTDSAMCLSTDAWPNQAGKLNSMGGRVFLIIGEIRLPLADFNTGYCDDGCIRRVDSNDQIEGFILYEDFSVPEHLRFEKKRLEFSPRAFACRS